MDPEESSLNNRKKCRRKRRKVVTELAQEYAENSSLHGLKYIAEKGRSHVEKIFWVVTFLVSISLCVILIKNVWIKWQTSPVIVALSEQLVSVGEVPFPSVTICPQIKAKRSVYNFTHETIEMKKKMAAYSISNMSKDEIEDELLANMSRYEDVGLVCWIDRPIIHYRTRNFSDATAVKHITEVSPRIEDIFYACRWRGEDVPCRVMFQPVVTSEGICFTMNSMAGSEIFRLKNVHDDFFYLQSTKLSKGWSLKRGYTNSSAEDVYPKKGRGNGADADVRVILKEQTVDRDGLCYGINHGYKVYLQHPADMPQSSLYYYAALPEQTSSFAVKFSVTNTSNTLVNYSPKIRQCFFSQERKLKYFRTYTPNNCRLECMSDYTFHSCGCVWFHMPHKNRSTCRELKRECVLKALERFAAEESITDSKVDKCQCLPLCIGVQYDAEILKTKFDIHSMLNAIKLVHPEWYENKTDEEEGVSYTMIDLYYKEPRYMSMRRSELFGLTDFLANCGGLLGLFLGFSFLSLVEIFYFCTLRLGCILRRETRNNENGAKQN